MQNKTGLFFLVFALPAALCGQSGLAQADVFQTVDSRGVVHLTNVPLDSGYRLLLRDPRNQHGTPRHKQKVSHANGHTGYNKTLSNAARTQNLDKALLQAVIAQESAFDPRALSDKGAVGLMQLMPATAQRYGVSDRYDPEQNIQGGARYLHDLMHQFHGNLPLVLAAYNAGEAAVERYGNRIPPFAETREYVPRVLNLYHQYRLMSP